MTSKTVVLINSKEMKQMDGDKLFKYIQGVNDTFEKWLDEAFQILDSKGE